MTKHSNEVNNFYKIMPKDLNKTYHNPGIKKHGMSIPFRALIIGGSGAGKSNTALEIIHRMSGTFEKIVICCKSKNEPLYDYLGSKIPKHIEFHEIGSKEGIPPVESYSNVGQMLIIFDDLVLDKKQAEIADYFIRGRKVGGSISCMYLSQSYFKVPKIIRIQCNYMFLKKLSSMRDLRLILSEFSLLDASSAKEALSLLTDMYKYATDNFTSFLMIDIDKSEFRKNFLERLS